MYVSCAHMICESAMHVAAICCDQRETLLCQFFHCVTSSDRAQIVRVGGKILNLLTHLAGPQVSPFIRYGMILNY